MRKTTIRKLLKGDVSEDLIHEIYLRMRDIPDKKVMGFGMGRQAFDLVKEKVLGPRLYNLDDPLVASIRKYLKNPGDVCSLVGETACPRSYVIEKNDLLIRMVDDEIIKPEDLYEDYRKGMKVTTYTMKLAIES